MASGKDQFYVVLADGVQPVSRSWRPCCANGIRSEWRNRPRVSPDVLGDVPVRDLLDVTDYPTEPLKVVNWRADPCCAWPGTVAQQIGRPPAASGWLRLAGDGRAGGPPGSAGRRQ